MTPIKLQEKKNLIRVMAVLSLLSSQELKADCLGEEVTPCSPPNIQAGSSDADYCKSLKQTIVNQPCQWVVDNWGLGECYPVCQ